MDWLWVPKERISKHRCTVPQPRSDVTAGGEAPTFFFINLYNTSLPRLLPLLQRELSGEERKGEVIRSWDSREHRTRFMAHAANGMDQEAPSKRLHSR